MKIKALLIIALAVLIFFLPGCSASNELQDALVIEAMGIDKKDGKVTVIIQALNTEDYPSNGSEAGGGKITAVHKVTGKTVDDALNNIIMLTGKEPIYSHNRVIVLGEGIYKDSDIGNNLNFFTRSYKSRSQVLIAAAKREASEIIAVDSGEGILGAKIIEEIIEAGKRNGLCANNCLYSYMNMYDNECLHEFIPILDITENKAEEKSEIIPAGTLITKKGKYRDELSDEETKALLFLSEKLNSGIITTVRDGTLFSLNIVKSDYKIKTDIKNAAPVITVCLNCTCELTEYTGFNNGIAKSDIQAIEQNAEEYLKNLLSDFMNKTVKQKGIDILYLSCKFLNRNTSYFMQNITDDNEDIQYENWQNALMNADILYDINVNVRRIGQEVIKKQ